MTNDIRRRQQRGVILLAIISLLTMFMLIGITYVVVSGHFKRAAVTNSKVRQLEVPPQKHLDGAMYQLLRDTDFAGSVVRGHSLLQDKYGHFALRGTVKQVTYDSAKNEYPAKNQILKINVELDNPALPLTLEPLSNPGALNGRVVTFLDGTFKNFSGRILKSTRISNNSFTLRILFPKIGSEHTSDLPIIKDVFLEKQILINGRDFSGTGFGLEPTNPARITIDALLPNRAADTKDEFTKFRRGGANEGYDVPDYQNMALAAQLSDPTTRQLQYVIPSFHRPALINYWEKRNATSERMDKVVMRPRRAEHPSFTGSNPTFNSIVGPWDVDNDGDGIRDSIWIDMGFPIQTDSSGRQYKPLFAVLCLDMDGRLNLNAHGNEMHLTYNDDIPRGMGYGPAEINLNGLFGSAINGYPAINGYRQLLKGNILEVGDPEFVPGRYHGGGLPGYNGIDSFSHYIFGHFPDNFVSPQNTSFQSMPDIHGELTYEINSSGNVVSQYISTDLEGNLRNTIADNPYEANLVSPNAADQLFSAHEMEALLRYHDPDNPQFHNVYTQHSNLLTKESSRLYRLTNAFNGNSSNLFQHFYQLHKDEFEEQHAQQLAYKVAELTTRTASANRRSVTTASFDPPVPAVQIPAGLRTETRYGMGSHTSQLLRARMLQDDKFKTELSALPSDADREALLNQRMSGLLAPKIFDGLRMDVNRPFGNGMDDNADGIVDNFIESASPEPLWPSRHFDPEFGDNFPWDKNKKHYLVSNNWDPNHRDWIWFDHDNDGFAKLSDPDAFLARYHYARHLYVLMLLMKDKNRIIDFGNGTETELETHRNIAQWAVNAVDFRDADSIMTPFEFDLNPFNGWDVDGIIHTAQRPSLDDGLDERALVWGTERPELLITESLAFHDQRTEDLDIDPAGDTDTFQDAELNTRAGRPNVVVDDDFDQRLLPNSGVFFELYNPWQSVYEDNFVKGSNRPKEFYQNFGFGRAGEGGVRLDQLSYYGFDDERLPGGATDKVDAERSPVWRMIIVRGDDKRRDPDAWDEDEVPWDLPKGKLTIERAIYFVDGTKPVVKIPYADTVEGDKDTTERFFYSPHDPNNPDLQPQPLGPGQYAVIGSGIYNSSTTKYPTYIGRHYEAEEDDPDYVEDGEWRQNLLQKTNKIELNPASIGVVHIPINYHYTRSIAKDADGIPISGSEEKSLSITEPVFGYSKIKFPTGTNNAGEPILVPTRDVPLDAELTDDPITGISRLALNVGGRMPVPNTTLRRGTTNDFAAVHLQRLANPLQPHNKATNPYRTIDTASIDVTAFNGVYKKMTEDDPPEPVRPTPLCNGLATVYNGLPVERVRFNSLERGWSMPQDSNMLWKHEPERKNNGPVTVPTDININGNNQIFRYNRNESLGGRNDSYPAGGQPFPWLQWNNRPFVSQLELMMVPRSSSSQLLKDYSFNNSTGTSNPYKVPNGVNGSPLTRGKTNAAYGHLLNFLESGSGSSNFHRLFDFTEVQSYFTGAQTYLNPYVFQHSDSLVEGTEGLRPPFNRISNFRDPGRINMNTIFDPAVFDGLMNNHAGPSYANWNDSRRGYEPQPQPPQFPPMHSDYPTFFAHPIKPAGSGDMVPSLELEEDDVGVSLLREKEDSSKPLFSTGYTDPAHNASRNPTFEYQSLQRLGNLTTGRSNVYSVWITVGYFEVTPSDGSLGAEVGIDQGRIKRHRAFYMIDRSIPVAFEPGENHNVDKAVILRRYVD